ncbi:MAG: M4 family metallopeptidase [Proteobacteria bacterium]|nr:M4 family metallopeptidase [Pseudomonadota bacterium]
MSCTCTIVPREVLMRLSQDKELSAELRKSLFDAAQISHEFRELRSQHARVTSVMAAHSMAMLDLAAAPLVTVYDCKHTQTLPGTPVPNPGSAADATAKRAFTETTNVAKFYKDVFNRNSIDDHGMTMMSSIHYGSKFNNAMWTGQQMLYGDGDGALFVDFTAGIDVIGHELTHGVTQHSLQLAYSGDAGGLNESVSDCFGSMFRQWEKNQDVNAADWLIGAEIMGPTAKARGFTCLRDMANPAANHCLAPQPTLYSQITPGMDPHYSSGPPNLAFCIAAKTLGGKSWERIGQVWYRSLTGFGPSPHMRMKAFADRTRHVAHTMYAAAPAVGAAVDQGWKHVGL